MISPQFTVKLAQILEGYVTFEETLELMGVFSVQLGAEQRWLSIAKALADSLNQGNTRQLVDSLVELCETRNSDGIANTSWEVRDHHYKLRPVIKDARAMLESSAAPSEVSVAAGNPFSAKSRVRELLETSTTDIFIVDPYVGVGTLDCLRSLTLPIRLLTATHGQAIETGFDKNLATFLGEGHVLTVRTSAGLHDRHLMFNDRCWLVGGSLKDAGKKPFNCIEIADKAVVVSDLEARWSAGAAYP